MRGAHRFGRRLVAQPTRDRGQSRQMLASRLGAEQQEHQIDRLTVDRFPVRRPLQPGERADRRLQPGKTGMRHGSALGSPPKPGCG